LYCSLLAGCRVLQYADHGSDDHTGDTTAHGLPKYRADVDIAGGTLKPVVAASQKVRWAARQKRQR